MVQAALILVVYFIPAPGSSGAAEGGLLFSVMTPSSILVLLWRFFTLYVGIIVDEFSLIHLTPVLRKLTIPGIFEKKLS